ncbi:MAG: hypothetical protein EZS28_019339 [Streblomastix strix]|uniref:SPRY domain-containing protein n=1 Tax=Streblomastix strix TaxID=222440 RepID=A0A5J4VS39_9EUKA|nr:MAG: hypothetical protein EZS28_019339 [Streblomastix strix]
MFGSIPILPSIDDCRIEGNSVFHTASNKNRSIIEFDPVITSGIAQFEAVFKNHEKVYFDIGVANATVRFDRNSRSSGAKGQSVYLNSGTGNMENLINNHEVSGNASFKCGQRVAAEVNMTSKTLRFFVDGVEQPNFVVSIPPAIRFFAFLWQEGSSFEVTKFVQFPSTSASATGLVPGSRSWEWGKEWLVEKVKQPRVPPNTYASQYYNLFPFIIPPGPRPVMSQGPIWPIQHIEVNDPIQPIPQPVPKPMQPPLEMSPPVPPMNLMQGPPVNRDSQSPPPRSPCTIPRNPSPSFFGIPPQYDQFPMPRQMVMK